MNGHSHSTPGLKLGVNATVAYHDRKGVHLVSLVRVRPPDSSDTQHKNTNATPQAPSGQTEPGSKRSLVDPLGPKQGAVAQYTPPGVFELDLGHSHSGGTSAIGALIGGLAGGGKGATVGAAAGTASGKGAAVGATASAASGANSSRTKKVSGNVISWGASWPLVDTKNDSENFTLFLITEDTDFENEIGLDDQIEVRYSHRGEESVALEIRLAHPPTVNP